MVLRQQRALGLGRVPAKGWVRGSGRGLGLRLGLGLADEEPPRMPEGAVAIAGANPRCGGRASGGPATAAAARHSSGDGDGQRGLGDC